MGMENLQYNTTNGLELAFLEVWHEQHFTRHLRHISSTRMARHSGTNASRTPHSFCQLTQVNIAQYMWFLWNHSGDTKYCVPSCSMQEAGGTGQGQGQGVDRHRKHA